MRLADPTSGVPPVSGSATSQPDPGSSGMVEFSLYRFGGVAGEWAYTTPIQERGVSAFRRWVWLGALAELCGFGLQKVRGSCGCSGCTSCGFLVPPATHSPCDERADSPSREVWWGSSKRRHHRTALRRSLWYIG